MTKIPLFWWKGERNFGDLLSPVVVKYITKKEVVHTTDSKKLLAIGSIMHKALPEDIIWGVGYAGFGNIFKDLKVYAVRGPNTREILLKNEIECPEVYGDPAILIKDIYKEYFSTSKEYKYGIIPHFHDYKKTIDSISDSKINVINVLSGIENVIRESTKCEVLFSSSLHGIILGESFNIPTLWVTVGERERDLVEWFYRSNSSQFVDHVDFKFEDYYLSTDRDKQIKVDWTNGINIDSTKKVIKSIESPKFNYKAMIDSFPHEEFNVKE